MNINLVKKISVTKNLKMKYGYFYRIGKILNCNNKDELIHAYKVMRDDEIRNGVAICLALKFNIIKSDIKHTYEITGVDVEKLKPILHLMSNYNFKVDDYKKLEVQYYLNSLECHRNFKRYMLSTKKRNKEVEDYLVKNKLYDLYMLYFCRFRMKVDEKILEKLSNKAQIYYHILKNPKTSKLHTKLTDKDNIRKFFLGYY